MAIKSISVVFLLYFFMLQRFLSYIGQQNRRLIILNYHSTESTIFGFALTVIFVFAVKTS